MFAPAVLLDARVTLKAATARLAAEPAQRWIVVRRQRGLVVLWYALRVADVRAVADAGAAVRAADMRAADLRAADVRAADVRAPDVRAPDAAVADATIEQALSLAGRRPAAVIDAQDIERVADAAVVLVGDELLGVIEPSAEPTAAEPARRLPGGQRSKAAARGGGFAPPARAPARTPTRAPPRVADAATTLAFGNGGDHGDDGDDTAVPQARDSDETSDAGERDGEATAAPEAGTAQAGAGAAHAAAAAPRPRDSEPFSAWPNVQSPTTVAPGQRFTLFIGLSGAPVAGVTGDAIRVALPAGTRRFPLDLSIVADGFDAPAGWRHVLDVDRERPSAARCEVPLVAPPGAGDAQLAQIVVLFTYRGAPCGVAVRRIAIVPAGARPHDDPGAAGQLWTRASAPAAMSVAEDAPAPDLTAWICRPDGNPCSGRFAWTFSSPHPVALPAGPLLVDLGADAAAFAEAVLRDVGQMENTELIDELIRGFGAEIAAKMPPDLFRLLREVAPRAEAAGRRPTLLIETAEAHVPWELALMEPPLDASRPPYLGCQAAVARWILQQPGPGNPPAHAIDVQRMAVVTAQYDETSGLAQLPMALQEGQWLHERYGAIELKATQADVNRLLGAALPGPAQAVHFACHGEADPSRPARSAVMLSDGRPLNARLLRSTTLGEKHRPFLFLNACQVGTAGEQLGSFSGFAGSTLSGGFRAFLAPLWNVDDRLAHAFASEFYTRVLGVGGATEPVGEVLADLRSRFVAQSDLPASATWLAYVFYGHPALRFTRSAG